MQVNGLHCSTKRPLPACFSRSHHPAQLLLEDASQEPALLPSCTHGWRRRGQGTSNPGKPQHLVLLFLQSYIRRTKEGFQLLLTGPCYTQFHYLLSHIPVSQVLKSHRRNRGAKLSSPYRHLPLSVWHTADYGISGGSPGPVPSSASTKAEVAVHLLPPTS